MAFEPGDEVVYEGSLGHHNGRVAAATEGGPVDVQLDGVGLVRTDEASLYGRYAQGGPIPAGWTPFVSDASVSVGTLGGPRGEATNIETGVTTPVGQPLPEVPAQPGSTPLDPAPGFAYNDLATPPEGNDMAPATEA